MNSTCSSKTYLCTTAGLIGFLGLTIAAAYVNLGPFNLLAAILISAAKALLIILFFMQVRGSSRLIWVAAATGFFWLAILFALAMSDFMTRH